MCGILGVVGPDSGGFAVNDALGAISHRGPNDSGLEHFEGAVLGNTRLSILDLTSAGHQPMTLPDAGLCLVHNGEVYNYLELKREFQGVPFRSCTDTEVILHAFAREGVECLHSLNGMFSFAVWDDRRKRLFAARDRLGIKPFYYAMHNGHLMFSSEVKALLALGHPRKPNDQVIWDYLIEGCYDHLDETFFKGIKKLPAGHYLEYDQAGGLSINRYWHLPEKVSPIRPEDSESEFRNRLEQIVEWECRSDVPVGILFSGGMDSSVLLGLMSEKQKAPVPAFSYAFSDPQYDQSEFMRPIVQHFSSPHIISGLGPDEFKEDFETTIWFQEEPTGSITITAFKKVFESIAEAGVGVVLSGNGLDELVAGYRPHHKAFLADMFSRGEAGLDGEIDAYCRSNQINRTQLHADLASYDVKNHARVAPVDGTQVGQADCVSQSFRETYDREIVFDLPFDSHLKNLMYKDLTKMKIPRALRFQDRMSMRFGIELRPPFLNHLLVEFCFGLDPQFLIRNGISKRILRDSMGKHLPSGFVNHPKRPVTHPQREWLREDLADWVWDIISSQSFRQRPYFNFSQVEKEFQNWTRGQGDNSFFMWQWLNVEMWMQKFIDPVALNFGRPEGASL